MASLCLAPILTLHGRLTLGQVNDAPTLDPRLAQRLQDAFRRGSGYGLLQLGASEVGTALPPVFPYWREFGALRDGALHWIRRRNPPPEGARSVPA
jgi:hypothetical protein